MKRERVETVTPFTLSFFKPGQDRTPEGSVEYRGIDSKDLSIPRRLVKLVLIESKEKMEGPFRGVKVSLCYKNSFYCKDSH